MATAKKLPSGSWRVLVYSHTENKKRKYKSFTAPTKAAAEYMAAAWKNEKPTEKKQDTELTVGEIVDKYINLSQTLSPTTLARYRGLREHGLPGLMEMKASELTDEICQGEINKELKRPNKRTGKPLAIKTIREEWSLISSSLKTICRLSYSVKLPKTQKAFKELPNPETVIQALKGSSIELPCLLSVWLSFSLSEVRGLKASSVRGGKIYVDQVVVTVEGVDIEKKEAKTESRKRAQSVPDYIMGLIEKTEAFQTYQATGVDGYLCPTTENVLYHRLRKLLKDNNIPQISYHDLRHLFASIMLTRLRLPEKVVQEEGGWSSPHIMQSVYNNIFSDSRKQADEIRDEFFKGLL